MIIDHVNIPVSDLMRSACFYDDVLAVFGYRRVSRDGAAIGYGIECWNFGIVETGGAFPALHLAFAASAPDQVVAFYEAAMAAGGLSNGEPGIRPRYDPGYFAAFVLDPDGHNIEAVYRG